MLSTTPSASPSAAEAPPAEAAGADCAVGWACSFQEGDRYNGCDNERYSVRYQKRRDGRYARRHNDRHNGWHADLFVQVGSELRREGGHDEFQLATKLSSGQPERAAADPVNLLRP